MEIINKQYIVDEHNRKIALQIPIETFERIEEIIENYDQLKRGNEYRLSKNLLERAFKDPFRNKIKNGEFRI